MDYHHERRTGDLVARVIADVDAMETSVLRNLSDLLSEMITFLVVAGVVIWLQPVIGLCVMLPLALSYFVIRRFSSRLKRIYEAVRARLGDIGTFVHDRLAGVQLTQSFAQGVREKKAFEAVTQAHYEQSVKALRARNALFPALGVLGFLSNVVMLGMGVWFIWRGAVYPWGPDRIPRLLVASAKSDQHAGANDRHAPAGEGRREPRDRSAGRTREHCGPSRCRAAQAGPGRDRS